MLRDLALLFLKLGVFGFGGPAAHIAMMRQEVVERRHWLTDSEFLDLLGVSNLIPGPSSTELAIHIGFRTCGWPGLLIAGVCFILPAACMVSAIAAAYVRFHSLPQVFSLMYGIKPVVVAIVLQALWNLSRAGIKNWRLAAVALSAGFVAALQVPPALSTTAGRMTELPTLTRIGVAFLKIGSIVFGSGYVLLTFLQADFVNRLHWLTPSQLLNAVAVGQVTPGPVFTTATFIGYLLAGLPGAAVATLAIFLPGWLLVAISAPFIPRLRRSKWASLFLDAVTAASIGLIAWVLFLLAKAAVIDPPTAFIAVASAALLFRYRLTSAWLILAGGAIGLLLSPHRT